MNSLKEIFAQWLTTLGVKQGHLGLAEQLTTIVFILIFVCLVDLICRRIIVPMIRRIVKNTHVTWDDTLLNERVLNEATKYKEVVFITFCTTSAYLGTDGLTRRTESVINALAHSEKISAVVHFGNPYALKYLLPVPRKIYGFMVPDAQLYAIDILKGTIEAKGTMPYDLSKGQ